MPASIVGTQGLISDLLKPDNNSNLFEVCPVIVICPLLLLTHIRGFILSIW